MKEEEDKVKPQIRVRAQELHEQGLPYQMAMAVASGRVDLSDALQRMATRDKVDRLIEQHDLSRALATQVAVGHADLDQVMARRRFEVHRKENRTKTCLVVGTSWVFGTPEGKTLRGEVSEVSAYEFELVSNGEATTVHKLKVMYAYKPSDWKLVKKGLKRTKSKSSMSAPAEKPQHRFSVSDKRIFTCIDSEKVVSIALIGGFAATGQIQWFSRYEFGLRLRSGAEVIIFRHGLAQFTVA